MQSLKDANFGEGIYSRVSKLFERLGRQIQEDQVTPPPGDVVAAPAEPAAPPPLPVQVVDPEPQPLQVLKTIIGPLIEPLATGGIVIVVVIFMLLKREDLRDRFIRLVGASDIHRTTEALEDAGRRVGQYLLMQLVVNVSYAIPIGLGLWIIGVPNAPLWALMALVLRFVPFIGPVISSIFPLALAVAVDPGWSMLLWTVALFAIVELVSNNIIEPWLYGSRTGLSPLAIILAAVLWTWLWGPIGLLLSTPLTVCLVVLGRHVPRFEFLDVMFGNKPVLQPHQQLYQRLLAGDPDEATERAEEFLQENDLLTFYDTVAIPALAVGELDRARGVMSDDRRKRVAESCLALVDNLEEYVEDFGIDCTEKRRSGCAGGRIEPGAEAFRAPRWIRQADLLCRRPWRARQCGDGDAGTVIGRQRSLGARNRSFFARAFRHQAPGRQRRRCCRHRLSECEVCHARPIHRAPLEAGAVVAARWRGVLGTCRRSTERPEAHSCDRMRLYLPQHARCSCGFAGRCASRSQTGCGIEGRWTKAQGSAGCGASHIVRLEAH